MTISVKCFGRCVKIELKQLEFFLTCAECGSLGKAAIKLYTSQPNVSKVIRSFENELGSRLFERTSKGLRLTAYGKSIYEYALNVVKNANIISSIKPAKNRNTFYVSTYQSYSMAQILINLYKDIPDINIEHRHGTVEEIITQVEQGVSELGVLYVAQNRLNAFLNIISGKKLEFVTLGKFEACAYVGPNSPYYHKESINFEQLAKLKYVRGLNDFFSVEDGLKLFDLGAINMADLQSVVHTSSDHLSTGLISQTDLVEMGINFDYPNQNRYELKNLSIEGVNSCLVLGYISEKDRILSAYAAKFIEYILEIINP